jgi:hypothetical protein
MDMCMRKEPRKRQKKKKKENKKPETLAKCSLEKVERV